MDKIQLWVDHLLETFGLEGDCVAYISHAVLALIAILLAVVAGLLCRRILVPIVLRLTKKTGAKWDDRASRCHLVIAALDVLRFSNSS